ncbi:PREDICTED: uncharacterized protein LOC108380915, partial [Rhagoletis zephyria]|uniref:uncharacterized protein LOC108380915 n=1 Tax=Rhagoletis zephyria TaxID=28612 RepID=UPI000811680F
MSDSAYKLKYQKYKIRVKTWEKDFKRKYSRIPSKYDIREAPQEIRDSYKMYYKLKTSFLEDTLNDVFDDDGFNVLEISQDEGHSIGKHHNNESLEMSSSIAALVGGNTGSSILNEFNQCEEPARPIARKDFEEKVVKVFDAVELCESNEKAWGPEVSKKPMTKDGAKCPQEVDNLKKPFLSNLSAKLFKSTSFSKRNPRKSLSRANSETNSQLLRQESAPGICQRPEILPDLETILVQKAKEQQSAALTANPLLS